MLMVHCKVKRGQKGENNNLSAITEREPNEKGEKDMTATTDQKARLLDLTTGVLELVRDGKRDINSVSAVLQTIKDDRDFVTRLLGSPVFSRDMRKQGWELVEDVSSPAEIVIANLETVLFLSGEGNVSGEVMRQRAVELVASLGQRHAEFLLEQQEEIPKEFRKYYLVFPGTVWRDSVGDLRVLCLRWHDGRWYPDFDWLKLDWDSRDRLLRPRK
jgi:hypothetical protein